ncbi:hypothetical protein [Burkholderia cepacia]|uniref:hypothetical protein n=1 Tax=Burkholderia cepacia TaxID=292 RepID=UPI00075540B4|nr:hypothetical protein [Burkholderia cepacia]KWF90338.1 hypothetical protein WL95_27295 [Burkholderia cepacia]
MDEREFEAWAKSTFGFWIDNDPPRVLSYVDGGCHPASTEEVAMWDALIAARLTTPDRDAIIEECAKVCDEHAKTSYLTEAVTCARKIRALKTAPTSDKGGA